MPSLLAAAVVVLIVEATLHIMVVAAEQVGFFKDGFLLRHQ
jgi:hypothetical protein